MYVINGSTGMPGIPVTDFTGQTSPDYSQCMFIVKEWELGTNVDPITIWNGQGGYINSVGNIGGGLYGIKAKPIDDTEERTYSIVQSYYVEGTTALFMYAAITGADLEHGTVTVYWDVANSWSDVGFNSQYDRIFYQDTWANAYGNIVTDERDWDESPSADENDPTNIDPQGGAFAETDPFGFGNQDMEIPDSVLELDYSSFVTAYTCDDAAIGNIGSAIFSDNTWQSLKLKFEGVGNPIDYIISAVEIPYSPGGSGKNFNLGGVDIETPGGSNISVKVLASRYHLLNFGSITLKETWGTEKDYSTTDVAIYLPYVGVKDLDASVLVNSTITVKAWLDAWTGDLLYMIHVNNKARAHKYLASSGILYHFQGNCGKQVPIGRADNSSQTLALFGAIGSMGVGLMSGNVVATLGGAAGMIGAAAMSPKVSMAGGISGAIGRCDQQDAWLIIKQSVPVYPQNWRAHFGAPRFQTFRLGDLNGFVKCYDVHAEIIGANEAERAAIEQALKAGVFVNV